MKKYSILLFSIALLLSVLSCSKKNNRINSVAPFTFNDNGDIIEIKGGWNYSGTKYESTLIFCDKALNVCSDYTARLYKGHLNLSPMLWKIILWEKDKIVGVSAIKGMYTNHALFIDRVNQQVFIVKIPETEKEIDTLNINKYTVVEKLQNTFYQINK